MKSRAEPRISRIARMAAGMLLALAGEAWAGWSTNWPSAEHPGKANVHIAELWTSVVERCTAAGVSAPAAWTYTDQHANLDALKDTVVTLLGSCVDFTQTNAAGNFTDWFTAGVTDFPLLTASSLCARANLPSNYLTYTPYSCLSGSGPNGVTNDNYGGIGVPYGWTNAWTVAAATNNLPPTRTTNCWFTTDYGFQGLKDAMAQLLWFKRSATMTASGAYNMAPTEQRATATSWADAMAYADTNTVYDSSTDATALMGSRGCRQGRDERRYKTEGADWFSGGKAPQVTGLSTELQHGAQFYLEGGLMPVLNGFSTTNAAVYSDGGLGLTTNQYSLWTSLAETADSTVTGNVVGTTSPPAWCDEPPFPPVLPGYGNGSLGCSLQWLTVTTWDGANGFQYK